MIQLFANLDKLVEGGAFDNKLIILFGANKTSDLTCSYLRSKNIKVSAIIDNYPEKRVKTLGGVNIYSPCSLFADFNEDKGRVVILIASVFYKEMKRSVYKYGFDDSNFIQTLYFAEYSTAPEAFQRGAASVIDGFEVYSRIKNEYGGDVFIIFNPCPSIGDAVFILSYIDEYIKQNGIKKNIYVLTGGASEKVAKIFGRLNYVNITPREAVSLTALYAFMGMEDVNVLSFTVPYTRVFRKFHNKGLLNWGDIIRGITMRLDAGAEKTSVPRPFVNIEGFCAENKIVKGKTAILATMAVQAESLPDAFWQLLVNRLNEKGYSVRINVAEGESVNIEGAEPLFVPLEYIVSTVEHAGVFIGLRSGLCDLVGSADCKKFAVYPDKNFHDFFGFLNIGLFDGSDRNIEIMYEGADKTVGLIMKNL